MGLKTIERDLVLKVLKEHDEVSTMEVAEKTKLSNTLARYYLKCLVFEGLVGWRRVGKRMLMWHLKEKREEE